MKTFLRHIGKPCSLLDDSILSLTAKGFYSGVFVALFLGVFQPFGISEISSNKMLIVAGFGFVSSSISALVLVVTIVVLRARGTEASWTLGKHYGITVLTIVLIAIGNSFYCWALSEPLAISNMVTSIWQTLAVGVFPVSFFIAYENYRQAKKADDQAILLNEEISEHPYPKTVEKSELVTEEIKLNDTEGKQTVAIVPSELLYMSSADNYVEIFTTSGKRTLLRTSLRMIEEQLEPQSRARQDWFRCHRSYIVNLQHVSSVEGNSAGLRLKLSDATVLPVSRSKAGELRDRLMVGAIG